MQYEGLDRGGVGVDVLRVRSPDPPKENRVVRQVCYFFTISSCLLPLMQRVQIFTRPPPDFLGRATHWRLGYLRVSPLGLNLVARIRFE